MPPFDQEIIRRKGRDIDDGVVGRHVESMVRQIAEATDAACARGQTHLLLNAIKVILCFLFPGIWLEGNDTILACLGCFRQPEARMKAN